MDTAQEMFEYGVGVMGLIARAQEEGLDTDEYERVMERGLTEEQQEVVSDEVELGQRIHLYEEDDEVCVPTALDKLEAGKKIPWSFKLHGVRFIVKAKHGMKQGGHSVWEWREDGYKFIFRNPTREDYAYSITIYDGDDL